MKSHFSAVALALTIVGQFTMAPAHAQTTDSLMKMKSEGAIVTAPDTAHKKRGMFGKLKSIAQNKTVQTVAKAAACQALPGGQYMMGAAEVARAKTSIASGVANSQGCIPGMGGASPLAGKGLAGAGTAGAMSALGGVAGGRAAAGTMRGMPAGGTITASAQGIVGMQAATAQMKAASAGTGGAAEVSTEAPGQQMKLSGSVANEIKKGKLTIKKIDWVHGSPSVSAPSTQGFMDLMLSAGQAMKAAGGTYRVDVYMDKKYSDQEIATLGAQRATVVISALQAGGQLGEAVLPGKIGKEKEQRVEIVKAK